MRARRALVAIVGRPNVGKSTLFNRLAKERKAIVQGDPGVTRDRIYASADWAGREFLVVDTGGITEDRDDLARQVTNQALMAAAEADVILFVVDARQGILPMDHEIAGHLRRIGQPVLLLANKAEGGEEAAADFYPLGLGAAMPISAEHGLGIGDFLDRLAEVLPEKGRTVAPSGIAVAVVGRPNVGKSSLVNALLGAERVIIGDKPGTTRDAVDTHMIHEGREFVLIDTAGLRRAARIGEPVEYYGVLRAIKAVERCDVALLVLAADEPVSAQDQRIAGLIDQAGKACLIVVNKCDLPAFQDGEQKGMEERIRKAITFLDYAPILRVSAKTGRGLLRIIPGVAEAAAEHARRIPTARLNEVLNGAVLVHEPPSYKGRKLRLFYATQVKTKPPVILIQVNDPNLLHFSYQRFLEHRFREAFGLKGTPFLLRFKARRGDG